MMYKDMNKAQLEAEFLKVKKEFENIKGLNLALNMSRGVPSKEQIELSLSMLDVLNSDTDCTAVNGIDCRNYGVLDGIPECKKLMADMLGVL